MIVLFTSIKQLFPQQLQVLIDFAAYLANVESEAYEL
jgi:hypothetical protein